MSLDEFFAFFSCLLIALFGTIFFKSQVNEDRLSHSLVAARWPLFCAIVLGLLGLVLVLCRWSAPSVRDNPVYFFGYLIMGIAWLALSIYLLPYSDLFPLDDVLQRNNLAASWAGGGAILGLMACYAGGNVGEGPGWWCVVFCTGLAGSTAFLCWILLNASTRLSETISIERNVAAGFRAGIYWLSLGLILGRAVAGDWTSIFLTIRDFIQLGWPVAVLTGLAIGIERAVHPACFFGRAYRLWQAVLPASLYLALTLLRLCLLGKP